MRNVVILIMFLLPMRANLHTVVEAPYIPVVSKIDKKDLLLLAKLIYSESPHEPYLGKLAVANVVINRSHRTGKSIKYVIYQKGQFDGIRSKRFKRVAKGDEKAFQDCLQAATEILNGKTILPSTVEFFHNPKTSTDSKWVRKISKYRYKLIGRHLFCRYPK